MKVKNILILMVLAALFSGCHDDIHMPNKDKADRTVLIYMAAQNSLGYHSYHKSDSIEIARGAHYLRKGKDVLYVLMDDATAPRLYEVTADSSFVLRHAYDEDLNTADASTLRDILTEVATRTPAEEYGLVMWSHGTGWLPPAGSTRRQSIGVDVGTDGNMRGDYSVGNTWAPEMSIDAMAEAIAASGVQHLRFVAFDACLMGCLEVAYSLKDATDYVIASPISTDADGANYEHQLKEGFFSTAPADIARVYVEDYEDRPWGNVTAAIRTAGLNKLATATSEVLNLTTLTQHNSPDLTDVLDYGHYDSFTTYRPHYYDAAQAMKTLLGNNESAYAYWRSALDDVVEYWGTTKAFFVQLNSFSGEYRNPNATDHCGISMFVPQEIYTTKATKATRYGDINICFQNTRWYTDAGFSVTGW